MIIAYHYCLHGNGRTILSSDISMNQIFAILFGSWGLLGVNCFMFISSYFLIDSNKFSSEKLLKIILQTIFYSSCILAVLYLTGSIQPGPKVIIKSIFSPFFQMYWFVTAYCMLYVVFPYLNRIIDSFSTHHLSKFLVILTLFVPVYKTIYGNAPVGEFIFFIYLYLIMGYLKKNPRNWFEIHATMGFLITSMGIVLVTIGISLIGTIFNLEIVRNNTVFLTERYSPAMVLDAIFLFYIFKNLRIKSSNIINTVSKTTLGIYLLHECQTLENILWDNILDIKTVYYDNLFVFYFVFSVLVLFVAGMLVDLIRIQIFEKPVFNIKNKYRDLLLQKFDRLINGFDEKIKD